jgi:hypothetical protein
MSTAIEDRPTIAERYACAMESSNLRTNLERGCDTDVLMAAGWANAPLGTGLYRLRAEFDSAKAEMRGQGATALIDTVLALSKMPSLSRVKQDLGAYAVRQATLRKFMEPDGVVLALVGQALQIFLDPTCPKCHGVGKTGGYGMPEVICKHCDSGKRTFKLAGRTDEQRDFIRFLIASMEANAAIAEDSMRKLLRAA